MQPSSFHFYYTSSYIKTTPIASIRLSFGNSFRCAQRCCLVICLATRYLLFRMYFARVSTIDAIRRRSTSSKTIAMYHRQNNSHINGIPSCISIYLFSYVVNWWHRYDAVNEHPRFSPITQRALIPNHAIVMTSTTISTCFFCSSMPGFIHIHPKVLVSRMPSHYHTTNQIVWIQYTLILQRFT